MPVTSVSKMFPIILDIHGKPLEDGYIYIGAENLDPIKNKVAVFWDADLTVPAAQPIRTIGGYPSWSGKPEKLYVLASKYSITVQAEDKSIIFTSPTSNECTGENLVDFDVMTQERYPPAGTVVGKCVQNIAGMDEVSVLDFIPKKKHAAIISGVSTYNATDAFYAASQKINTQGGGKLVVPAGTYIVGKQMFAGATNKGYAYSGLPVILIMNCSGPVVVEFRGAVMKLASGLKFGAFDPVTGNAYTCGSLDRDYQAHIGVMVDFRGNRSVRVIGSVELNGNIQDIIAGGTWGGTGRQCVAHGIRAYSNDMLYIENVWTHHHATDGIVIAYPGLTTKCGAKPTTLHNIVSENNARQGFSLVGGNGVTVTQSKFNNTGKDIPFYSAPGAGVDLEAEGGAVIRNVVFCNCEMVNNAGCGMVSDSGSTSDVTFMDCKFIGTTNASIWPRVPRIVFKNCVIVGWAVNAFGSLSTPDDATQFFNCTFTDDISLSPTKNVYVRTRITHFNVCHNVLLQNCTWLATRNTAMFMSGKAILSNCTVIIRFGTECVPNRGYAAHIEACFFEGLTVHDKIAGTLPDYAYWVYIASSTYQGTNCIISPPGRVSLLWLKPNVGQYSGCLPKNTPE